MRRQRPACTCPSPRSTGPGTSGTMESTRRNGRRPRHGLPPGAPRRCPQLGLTPNRKHESIFLSNATSLYSVKRTSTRPTRPYPCGTLERGWRNDTSCEVATFNAGKVLLRSRPPFCSSGEGPVARVCACRRTRSAHRSCLEQVESRARHSWFAARERADELRKESLLR